MMSTTGSHRQDVEPQRRRRRILIAMVGVLGVGLSAAAAGTLSSFTSNATRSQDVSSATFVFNVTDPASVPFSSAVSGMSPGDSADRLVTIVNNGTADFGAIPVAVTAPSTTSLLDTDATNGLALTVDDCSVAWVQASSSAAATCSATLTHIVVSTPVATLKTTGFVYANALTALTHGNTDYLRFHYDLPSTFSATTGLSSTIVYSFTATQATGTSYH